MSSRPRLLLPIILASAALLGAVAGLYVLAGRQAVLPSLPFAVTIGAPFTLTSHQGRTFDSATLAGRPFAIFFGFTNCPDICPTTLLDMSNHLQRLGPAAERLQVLFVTVDPARDTPEHLARYLSSFDPRIVGLTGPEDQIRRLAHAYRVKFRKVPTGDGYTIDHTASVFLMDANARFRATLDYQEPDAAQLAKISELVGP
jgi:protein SCO1